MSIDYAIVCNECKCYELIGTLRANGFCLNHEDTQMFIQNHIKHDDLKIMYIDAVPVDYYDEFSNYDFRNKPRILDSYEITKEDIYDDTGESITSCIPGSCKMWEFKYTIEEGRKIIDTNPINS